MLFYRVENEKGCGPYRNSCKESLSCFLETKIDYKEYLNTHPTPNNEALNSFIRMFPYQNISSYVFGFSSIQSLKDWFNTGYDEEYMKQYNFHISVYEIRKSKFNIAVGDFQATALKDKLKFIKTIPFVLKDL